MEEASTELVKGSVYIPISSLGKSITQQGDLTVPSKPKGIILFAHGSGSGRNSPRNKFVAEMLNRDGLATLLVDLLTPEEEESDTIMEKQRDKISVDCGGGNTRDNIRRCTTGALGPCSSQKSPPQFRKLVR